MLAAATAASVDVAIVLFYPVPHAETENEAREQQQPNTSEKKFA